MAEWGRKEYAKKWPSRTPVWTWTAILLTLVFFAGMLTLPKFGFVWRSSPLKKLALRGLRLLS